MSIGEGVVVVQVSLEGLVVTEVGITLGSTVIGIVRSHLRIVRAVAAVGALAVRERVVGIPVEAIDDVQGSLTDELVTLPHGLREVLVDHRQGVVVSRSVARSPTAVSILDGVRGVEVVHSIQNRCRTTTVGEIGHGHTHVFAVHGVDAYRHVEVVLQYLRAEERANVQAVHVGSINDTLTVHVVDTGHILGLGIATVNGNVVVVRDTGAQNLILPVGVATLVVGIVDAVLRHVVADVAGRSHIERLGNLIESHISVVAHVGTAFVTALGGDDNHAVGSLRTVDSRCRSIAQHVDRLNVVRCYHRDVDSGNTVDDVVRLHGSALTQRRCTTQRDGRSAVGVARTCHDQTGHLALQHGGGVSEHTTVEVLGLHRSDRRGDVLTLHRAVTYDDDLVQQLVVFLQRDALAGSNGLRLKTHVRDVQLGTALDVDRVTSVDVGHHAILSSGFHDTYADERFTLRVADDTRHLVLCHCCRTAH